MPVSSLRSPATRHGTAFALALTVCIALAARAQPTDADFIAARDAYRAGDSARLERVAPRLKGHLLDPYVAYWQLKLKLAMRIFRWRIACATIGSSRSAGGERGRCSQRSIPSMVRKTSSSRAMPLNSGRRLAMKARMLPPTSGGSGSAGRNNRNRVSRSSRQCARKGR